MMYKNYLEQVLDEFKFVNDVAKDIIKNDFSAEILLYAKKNLQLEIGGENTDGWRKKKIEKNINELIKEEGECMIRLNWGESYCYLSAPNAEYSFLIDELNEESEPDSVTYEEAITILSKKDGQEFTKRHYYSDIYNCEYENSLEYIPL